MAPGGGSICLYGVRMFVLLARARHNLTHAAQLLCPGFCLETVVPPPRRRCHRCLFLGERAHHGSHRTMPMMVRVVVVTVVGCTRW